MDKLIIDTPEQVHLELMLAGVGSRFMAAFLDSLIQGGILVLVFLLAVSMLSVNLFNDKSRIWALAALFLIVFAVMWGYYALFETLWKGQTPGKRWAGIRVIKDSGRPISAFEAIARNLVRVVDYLPGFYGIGVVTMMLNRKNQRLGDFVAGTLVVHESSDRETVPFYNRSGSSDYAFPQAANLTIQEAELIEAFLARRLDIASAVRQQTALRIAAMVCNRLAIPVESRPADNEEFLELIVKEFRNRARLR